MIFTYFKEIKGVPKVWARLGTPISTRARIFGHARARLALVTVQKLYISTVLDGFCRARILGTLGFFEVLEGLRVFERWVTRPAGRLQADRAASLRERTPQTRLCQVFGEKKQCFREKKFLSFGLVGVVCGQY